MISNPNDSALEKRVAVLEELMRANPFESASVSQGRLRFIGGLLRVDSGGSVEIVGTLAIDGTTTVTGSFTVTGPWGLDGDGTITGDVTITGNVTSTGTLIQNGPWELNGVGDITGDVALTGDLTVLPGGKIQVGDMIIDPANNGSVTFPGGAVVRGSGGTGVVVEAGDYFANVRQGYASFGTASRHFEVDGFSGLSIVGVPTGSPGPETPANVYYRNAQGQLRVATGS